MCFKRSSFFIFHNYYVFVQVPGHEYQFRVKAVNKEGESEPLETMAPIVAKDPFCKLICYIPLI